MGTRHQKWSERSGWPPAAEHEHRGSSSMWGQGPPVCPASPVSHARSVRCLIRKAYFQSVTGPTGPQGGTVEMPPLIQLEHLPGGESHWAVLCGLSYLCKGSKDRSGPTNCAVLPGVLMLSFSKWQKLFSPLILFVIFYFYYYFSRSQNISTFFFF